MNEAGNPVSDTVAVLVVNFRTPELTAAAVLSALEHPEVVEVIVVDNGSADGSIDLLRAKFRGAPLVTLVESARNIGFAAGNNLAAVHATARFLFLLNSDAVLHYGAIASLIGHWHAAPTPGPVAPLVLCADGATPQLDSFGRFPTPANVLLRRIHRNIPEDKPDFVSGCAMLIERSEFDAIGGFDERFFMYFEDVELCWRLRKNGKYAYRCLTAHVTHLGGKSYRDHSSQRDDYAEAQDLLFRVMSTPKPAIQLLRAARSVWRFTLAVRSATARVMQNPAA